MFLNVQCSQQYLPYKNYYFCKVIVIMRELFKCQFFPKGTQKQEKLVEFGCYGFYNKETIEKWSLPSVIFLIFVYANSIVHRKYNAGNFYLLSRFLQIYVPNPFYSRKIFQQIYKEILHGEA